MGQLAQGKGKIVFLADIHSVSTVGSITWGAWIKVEHDLHRNVCKMGVVHESVVVLK